MNAHELFVVVFSILMLALLVLVEVALTTGY